jgi:hypothetical protein
MIDWEKSAKLNNCSVVELQMWFDKYSSSSKRIIAICDNPKCKKEREMNYQNYRSLCLICSQTDEKRKKLSIAQKKRYEDPLEHEKSSNAQKKYCKDNPISKEQREKQSKVMQQLYENPLARKKTSDAGIKRFKNLLEREKMSKAVIGTLVKHHYIYDFSDWNKYTILITRAEHNTIHANLKRAGLEVPCINIMVGD